MNDLDAILSKLHDIHEPDSVAMWPLAPGWWALVGLIVLAAIAAIIWKFVGKGDRPARREALRQLHQLRLAYSQHGDGVRTVGEISILLRRACLARYPRANVAGLTGDAWLDFLDQSGRTREFTNGAGRILITAPYRDKADGDIEALVGITSKWLFTAR